MNLAEYDYELPEELIAQFPASERDGARLMVLDRRAGRIDHAVFRSFPDFLRPGDCLVVNETRVFPARLNGYRPGSGGAVELLLVRRSGDCWEVLARPGRRLRAGAKVAFQDADLVAEVTEVLPSGRRMVRFKGAATLERVLESQGRIPLPPYIRREADPTDRERYQSVYARTPGAIAAPTAGLHFTTDLLDRIRSSGVEIVPLLLHVGPGTFKPVEVQDPRRHEMDAEYFEVGPETAAKVNACRGSGGRVVAVGTTTVRALEGSALRTRDRWTLNPGSGWTRLFVHPPYRFKLVDALVTNFHLPRSTLLMLVSAFAERAFILQAYEEAVRKRYRFYSYGDAMLIL